MNYIRKRLEGLDAADRDPDEPPTTPRKEKQKVFASSPRSTPSQMHTPDSEPVEEVTQTSATQYVAALRYYDAKQTPKDAATTLGRLFNQNVALRPAIVVRALPMLITEEICQGDARGVPKANGETRPARRARGVRGLIEGEVYILSMRRGAAESRRVASGTTRKRGDGR